MKYTQSALKNLFLQQSYLDAWNEYDRQLKNQKILTWDYVILTASNEAQAEIYRQQISYRLENKALPSRTEYHVLPDPEGKRVGSGGATFAALDWLARRGSDDGSAFFGKRILVIHSGGDSRRIPQYSVCGKLFAPVPRELPNGMVSALFDEFMIAVSMIPGRIREGMLVLSGDVLLLFNALQIDGQFHGAAAISMKEDVSVGRNHGVFLNDGKDMVQQFLHKQPEEVLYHMGAVNGEGKVDLDTGAVLMEPDMLQSLYSLLCTDGRPDREKYQKFVNERARVSFYGDFLYPLASAATLEAYLEEKPEGEFCPELEYCRRKIWEVLKDYRLKLLSLSPAEFIHFGTTGELLNLVTESITDYAFLGWKKDVYTNASEYGMQGETFEKIALHNTLFQQRAVIGEGSYIENCYLYDDVRIGRECVVSGVTLKQIEIPSQVVLHGVKLSEKRFVVRIYHVSDNPKGEGEKASFLSVAMGEFLAKNHLSKRDIWSGKKQTLWFAKIYPVADNVLEAVQMALLVYRMAKGEASEKEIQMWKRAERESLYSSFDKADGQAVLPWQEKLKNRILIEKFLCSIRKKTEVTKALGIFRPKLNEKQYQLMVMRAEHATLSEKIRIYYALARMLDQESVSYQTESAEDFYNMCFGAVSDAISGYVKERAAGISSGKIVKKEVTVKLPVRVNWGGGWTDTPPYCLENGGTVLNAAVKLQGQYPVCVTLRRLDEYKVELESQDIGVHAYFTSLDELGDCSNPYDCFALHKAALAACGIIPMQPGKNDSLTEILKNLGGGIYLSTQVLGIPKGSGLGTSSILAGACVRGIFMFMGKEIEDGDLYDIVLCMEQLMSTGGGWQDQVGGLSPGIKFITTKPGLPQKIQVQRVDIPKEAFTELNDRFALIYTGQRRLARNLLRDVVGGYIGGREESVEALQKMARIAALMRFELERGDIDAFAGLLNEHWRLSVQLDAGSTNTCIEQIFLSCEDLLDGRFIAGAGGGGFLQVILKKGVTKEKLRNRLKSVFQDSGVDVWDCELLCSE